MSTGKSAPLTADTQTCSVTGDTLYRITAAQLRSACRIFVEHGFQQRENELLNERVALLEQSGRVKSDAVQVQQQQIGALNEIILKKDMEIRRSKAVIDSLNAQIAEDRKRRRRHGMLVGGAVAALSLSLILK